MSKKMLYAAALAALAVPALAQDKQEKPAEKPAPEKQEKTAPVDASAKPAPYKIGSVVDEKVALTDIDGKPLTFKDLRGKVVAIHFWSKDCPFEKVADPKVQKLEEHYAGNKDVVFVAINANSSEIGDVKSADGYAAIREHMKAKGLKNRLFADHGNKVADLFNAQSTPHCFVLDKTGKVVYAGGLDDDPKGEKGEATQQYLRDAIEAALAGKEPAVKESKPYGCSIKRVKA